MKKIIILFAGITMLYSSLEAQQSTTDVRKRFLFGVKAGINYSNVYDSKGEDFIADPKVGLATGAFLSIPFGTYIGIQPEILISQKGFKSTGSVLGGKYNLIRTSTFLDIPLLFAFKPSEFFTLLAGPQFSYLFKQNDAFKNGTTTIEQEKEFVNEDIRNNIIGFTAGIDLTMKHIVLSARAGWDLQKNSSDGNSNTPRYKNIWYQATIGYRFYRS